MEIGNKTITFEKKEYTIKKAKKLGRKKLIQIAINKIQTRFSKPFETSHYDHIRVESNSKNIRVKFYSNINLILLNTAYVYGVTVNLFESSMSYGLKQNPNDLKYDFDKMEQFIPNEKSEKALKFILDSINKSEEVGNIDKKKMNYDQIIEIYEFDDYYSVTNDDPYTTGFYKISKSDGKVYDDSHKHKMRDSYKDKDPYILIKK
ncbi:hypothetical protein M0811_02426 [Anaeramoeba ignava]|uniref:Uncharacterized protein n=1 Tax=Anaeramoeba ignava TaxID=1746090 RepID=A0A9Q0L9B6_ANAIG|nr:hypothetical protein M0811_02426 [Anaeramoeba ignava]